MSMDVRPTGYEWNHLLLRDLLEIAEENLETAQRPDEDEEIIQLGLSCLRGKAIEDKPRFPSDSAVRQIFDRYMRNAIQAAAKGLIEAREFTLKDPFQAQLNQMAQHPTNEQVTSINGLSDKEKISMHLAMGLSFAQHPEKVAKAKREIPLLQSWLEKPETIFTTLLPPI